jgi:hypothetical protein
MLPGRPDNNAHSGVADRLTGVSLVVWEDGRRRLRIYAAVMIALMCLRLVVSVFRPVPHLVEFLRLADALPFSSRTGHATEPITYGFLFLFASFFDSWVVTKIRPLRALPVSPNLLSAIPATLGLLSATMLWTVLFVVHIVFVRSVPLNLRIDLFVAFASMAAITMTLRMIAPGPVEMRPLIALIPWAIVLLAFARFLDALPKPVGPAWSTMAHRPMLVGGVVVLAASFVSMRIAITRSSRIYRPLPAPVRFGN